MTFTFTAGQKRFVRGWRTCTWHASLPAYLHSSVKHGDGRGRPHKRVRVGFSLKYPAALKRNWLYSTSQTSGKRGNYSELPAEQRREQPQIGHYELLWEAELDSGEEGTETLRTVLW